MNQFRNATALPPSDSTDSHDDYYYLPNLTNLPVPTLPTKVPTS